MAQGAALCPGVHHHEPPRTVMTVMTIRNLEISFVNVKSDHRVEYKGPGRVTPSHYISN